MKNVLKTIVMLLIVAALFSGCSAETQIEDFGAPVIESDISADQEDIFVDEMPPEEDVFEEIISDELIVDEVEIEDLI